MSVRVAMVFLVATMGIGSADPLPEALDRAAISAGVNLVKHDAEACGTKPGGKGKVIVKSVVDGEGKVTSVVVRSTPTPELGACVAAAMQKATYAKTQKGGTFSYPFVF